MQDVLPEETRAVAEIEQGQQGRADVDLRCQRIHLRWRDVARRPDQQRDMKVLDRQISLAAPGSGVVRENHENRIVKPGMLFCLLQKLTDRPVGVFDRALTAGARGNVDPSIGIGIRTMIGGCHDVGIKQLAGLMPLIKLAQRQAK